MIKKIIFIAILSVSSLLASGVQWEKDYNSGVSVATKENKPMLFISSRHSCKYCVILDENALSDARVVKALTKDFVSVISYSDDGDYLPRELWRPGTPAIWFLFPDGTPMYQPVMGAVDADNFLNALAIVKEAFDAADKERKAKVAN